jgi:hypothetical protein
MALVQTDREFKFADLRRNSPFSAILTLYTRSGGKEDPKEHFFFKVNAKKAITLDKRVTVYIPPDKITKLCTLERKPNS